MSLWQGIGLTILPHIGGFAGSLITRTQVKKWYETIERPSWRPPNWLFAPVWTSLYTGMGYASYLILRDGVGEQRKLALGLYASQLALNWLWTPIFFQWHKLGLASAEILLLAANIGACIYTFYPINKNAAYLMVPYLAWVSFASALTLTIWGKNKDKNKQY